MRETARMCKKKGWPRIERHKSAHGRAPRANNPLTRGHTEHHFDDGAMILVRGCARRKITTVIGVTHSGLWCTLSGKHNRNLRRLGSAQMGLLTA